MEDLDEARRIARLLDSRRRRRGRTIGPPLLKRSKDGRQPQRTDDDWGNEADQFRDRTRALLAADQLAVQRRGFAVATGSAEVADRALNEVA